MNEIVNVVVYWVGVTVCLSGGVIVAGATTVTAYGYIRRLWRR